MHQYMCTHTHPTHSHTYTSVHTRSHTRARGMAEGVFLCHSLPSSLLTGSLCDLSSLFFGWFGTQQAPVSPCLYNLQHQGSRYTQQMRVQGSKQVLMLILYVLLLSLSPAPKTGSHKVEHLWDHQQSRSLMKCDQADSVRYIEPTRDQAAFAASSVLPLRHSQNCPFLLPPTTLCPQENKAGG